MSDALDNRGRLCSEGCAEQQALHLVSSTCSVRLKDNLAFSSVRTGISRSANFHLEYKWSVSQAISREQG
jgi:hypothetical protein